MASKAQRVQLRVTVSKSTVRDIRALLGAKSKKRGELSRFVEQALNERVFRLTVWAIKERTARIAPEKLEAMIDEAVVWARKKSPAEQSR